MLDCQAFLKKGISINLYISTAAIELGKNHLYEVPLLVWIDCVGGGAGGWGVQGYTDTFHCFVRKKMF